MSKNRELADSIFTEDTGTYTSSSTLEQTVNSFNKGVYRSALYFFSITSGSEYQTSTVKVIHDGSNAYLTESDVIMSGSTLASFTASISGDDVQVKATPTNSTTTFNFRRSLVKI